MSTSNDRIRSYLQAVDTAQSQAHRGLSADELAVIAAELGTSDDLLALTAQRAEHDLRRGYGFLRHDLHDPAIKALRRTRAVRPDDTVVMCYLAHAHLARAAQRSGPWGEDHEQADHLAHLILEVDPEDAEAYKILSALATLRSQLAAPPGPLARLRALFDRLWRALTRRPAPPPAVVAALPIPPLPIAPLPIPPSELAPAPTPSPQPSPRPQPPDPADLPSPTPTSVPLRWIAPPDFPLRLVPLDAEYRYGYLHLAAYVHHDQGPPVHAAKLRIDVYDADHTRQAAFDTDLLSILHTPMLAGDVVGFRTLVQVLDAQPAYAELRPRIDPNAGPDFIPDAQPTPLDIPWEPPPSAALSVRFRLRGELRRSHLGRMVFHRLFLDATNTGDQPIRLLRVRLRHLQDQVVLLESTTYVASAASGAPMLPGQTTPFVMSGIVMPFAAFELAVIEAS